MKCKQNGKKQIIALVGLNFVVENDEEENYQNSCNTLHEGSEKIVGTGVPVNVFIESGQIIVQQPEYGNQE